MSEKIPIVVCSKEGYFGDDLKGECSKCGEPVVHRPHIPQPSTLMCLDCYLEIATPEDKLQITPETVEEFKQVVKEMIAARKATRH